MAISVYLSVLCTEVQQTEAHEAQEEARQDYGPKLYAEGQEVEGKHLAGQAVEQVYSQDRNLFLKRRVFSVD